jgi:hypothetical protein
LSGGLGQFGVDNADRFIDDLFTVETANNLIFAGYEPGILKFVIWLLEDDYAGLRKYTIKYE